MVTKARSPNYPAFGLGKAIELIRQVHADIHHHKAPDMVVLKSLGYTSKNGRSLAAISALKKYGLLEEVNGEFKVSKDALAILFEPQNSPAKKVAMERAAFAPELFKKLRREFAGPLPNDELFRSFLMQNGFLLTTVGQAIKSYRDTVALVEGAAPGYNEASKSEPDESSEDTEDDPQNIEIGDLVQWESSGVLRMAAPSVVRAFQEHDGKIWAFVEGSETGIPMEELLLEKKGAVQPVAPPRMPLSVAAPIAESAAVGANEEEWLKGRLAKDASFRIIINGTVGPREIGKLIKLLEAQKLVLDDDEEESLA